MVNLRSLVSYFEKNIRAHKRVADCNRVISRNEDEHIYEIRRTDDLSTLRVYISDAYGFSSGDYASRPKEIKAGDFILVDTFAGGPDGSVVEEARRDRIAVGPWRKLFGALNSHDVWLYRMPEEKQGNP